MHLDIQYVTLSMLDIVTWLLLENYEKNREVDSHFVTFVDI